jgi:site-specific recombinase XerD
VISDMPRPRPLHLQREKTRHGTYVWVHRIGKGPRTRIRGEYGTPEFLAAYQAAEAGQPIPVPSKPGRGSLAWLIAQYRDSGVWLHGLSAATKRQRENIFKHVLASAGTEAAAAITSKSIKAGLERRKTTPSQARNFLDAMRGLFVWAVSAEHVKADPTEGVKAPPRPKTKGFLIWSEEDEEAFKARWPLGTRQRVWFEVLRCTGLRRGDAVTIGRQHVRKVRGEDVIVLRTEKSSEEIVVAIPILPPLAQALAAGPVGDLTFIVGANGKPLTKESFGNEFSAAARQAGVRKSAHGLRKVAATVAAENGATEVELESLLGWKRGSGTSKVYTADANRMSIATAAAAKLLRTPDEQAMPAPSNQVRASSRKLTSKQRLGK